MAVRIRMKRMGRTHRPYYRICAFDHHAPRDGRAIEELGTYDTSVVDTDARAILKTDRIDYWLSVGAQPSEKVAVLIKKYGTGGTHTEQQKMAIDSLAAPKSLPDPGAPAPAKEPEEPATAEATGTEVAGTESAGKEAAAAPAEKTAETPADETTTAEKPAEETAATESAEEPAPPAAE